MKAALFINGIYEGVFAEILKAQEQRGGGESYIQPYSGNVIRSLKKHQPSSDDPVRLYASTTANLSQICYVAEIVAWEDKRTIAPQRRAAVLKHLSRYQQKEVDLFTGAQGVGATALNLITIRNLRKLDTLHSTSLLTKVTDQTPLKARTRAGGWSEVLDLGDVIALRSAKREELEADLARRVGEAAGLSDHALQKRLASAPRLPERVQVISIGFRRNPGVIVAVLRRANGVCERCRRGAPFKRRSDGTPFLEVHHWVSLSDGGEDTVENAAALCPNCHRELHHGESGDSGSGR